VNRLQGLLLRHGIEPESAQKPESAQEPGDPTQRSA
jgi:hypothetical protein